MEYIRHRRLAQAASELAGTRRPIVEIALDWGYSTHESFLRAFRTMYGSTPSSFRKRGRLPAVHKKADLIGAGRTKNEGERNMIARLTRIEPFKILGSLIHTTHGSCKREVAALWAREEERAAEAARTGGEEAVFGLCFGACDGCCGSAEEGGGESFPYLVGWKAAASAAAPDGLVEMEVAGGLYALFAVEGGDAQIAAAMEGIYSEWLPSSSFDPADAPVLERYELAGRAGSSERMEIWLPLKERS
jgi:AraC family transcriptional regulator